MNKILITGANSYIGSNLKEFLRQNFRIYSLVRKEIKGERVYQADIRDAGKLRQLVKKIEPDVVIHTAWLTGLKRNEENPDLAHEINVGGTKNLVEAIKQMTPSAKLLFISSEGVFKGDKGDYKEMDKCNPQTVYGKTKLLAERYIRKELKDFIVCRTANAFGGGGGSFFNFLLDALKNNQKVDIYKDVFYNPTYIGYLMDCLRKLIEMDFKGVIHIVGQEKLSRYQFARKVAKALNKDLSLIKPANQPKDGLWLKDCSLNTQKVRKLLNNFCPSLEKALHYCFGNLIPPYFYFADDRGKILGINQTEKWAEVNFIESVKGAVRGNHYHKETREGIYIIEGEIKVSIRDLKKQTERSFIVEGGDIFFIEKYHLHSFEVMKDSKWINMLTKVMKEGREDIFKPE